MPLRKSQTTILTGWKDIANYLGKGVRTVQRYEVALRLPIRRVSGNAMSSVIATKADLDGWVSSRRRRVHSIRDVSPMARRFNALKADFLQIDSEVALTFSGMALIDKDTERRKRKTLGARKAYDAIKRLRHDVYLSDMERNILDVNVARLKNELQTLGEIF